MADALGLTVVAEGVESFAQLDPENMHLALDAVVSRGSAVLLIAHP